MQMISVSQNIKNQKNLVKTISNANQIFVSTMNVSRADSSEVL